MAKSPAKKKAPLETVLLETVTVECVCSNVHLGNGVVLRATRPNSMANWENGDHAELSRGVADRLVKNGQVKIVG